MTHEEIDKWIEDHVKGGDKGTRDAFLMWGKIIAHKFYEFGKRDADSEVI